MISRPLAPPTLFPDGKDRTRLCGGRSAGRRTAAPASPPDRGSETSLPALLPGPGRPSRGHGTLLKEQRGVIALGTGRYAKHKGGRGQRSRPRLVDWPHRQHSQGQETGKYLNTKLQGRHSIIGHIYTVGYGTAIEPVFLKNS